MDNIFFVGVSGSDIVILKPVPGRMSKEDAMNLAAWIVALTDEDEFAKKLADVQGT